VWTWQQVFDSLERGDRIHVVAGPIVTIVRQA
jgi:preprotein translocase subunit YajC